MLFVTGDHHHTLGTKKTMAFHVLTSLNYDYLQKLDMSNVDVLKTQYGSPFIRASLNPLLSLLRFFLELCLLPDNSYMRFF